MEIKLQPTDEHITHTFKIDLIVWKFLSMIGELKTYGGGFKIDLIVWK